MLFAKVLSLNCEDLEYANCNFTTKNMNSRDRGEKLTKEGAARVCIYKLCNIIHSYTLECGLHYTTIRPSAAQNSEENKTSSDGTTTTAPANTTVDPKSSKTFSCPKNLPVTQKSNSLVNSQMLTSSSMKRPNEELPISSPEKDTTPVKYYSIESYENLGQAMLVSLLDIFEKNPQSIIPKTVPGGMKELRRQIAGSLNKISRFRNEGKLKSKIQHIDKIIKESFYDEFEKKKVFDKILLKPLKPDTTQAGKQPTLNKSSLQESCKSLPDINSGEEGQDGRQELPNKLILETIKRRGRREADFENRTSDEEDVQPHINNGEDRYTNESSEERSLSKRPPASRAQNRDDSDFFHSPARNASSKDRRHRVSTLHEPVICQNSSPKVLSRQKEKVELLIELRVPESKPSLVEPTADKTSSMILEKTQQNEFMTLLDLKQL